MDIKELLSQEAEAAELAENVTDDQAPLPAHVKVTRGNGRGRTLQIRLNAEEYLLLERIAKARLLPVSTVARAVLLSAIAPREEDAQGVMERMEQDLAAIRRLIDRK